MLDLLQNLLSGFLILICICLGIGISCLVALVQIIKQIKDLEIPPDPGFFATMHYVPLLLVVLLDLLDLGFDIFAAPVAWLILDRMGLQSLRNRATIEALIPFTQPIPTFTLAWLLARMLKLGQPFCVEAVDSQNFALNPPVPSDEDELEVHIQ